MFVAKHLGVKKADSYFTKAKSELEIDTAKNKENAEYAKDINQKIIEKVIGFTNEEAVKKFGKNDNTFVTHPHATQLSAFNALWDGNSGVFTADQDMTVKAWISMWVSSEQQTFTTSNRVAILARVKRADPSSYSTGVSPTGWPTIAGSGASVNVSCGVSQGAHGGHFLVDSGDSFLNYGSGSSNVSGGNYTIGSRFCTCSDYINSSSLLY